MTYNREFHDGLYEIRLYYKTGSGNPAFTKVKDIIIDDVYISFTDAYGDVRFYKKDDIDTFIIGKLKGDCR